MSNSILELENNKKRIKALMNEVNRRMEAINVLNKDIKELKKENAKLKKELELNKERRNKWT